ncbi:glycoside hydrolase [Flavisolibacter tropicus]|uniref:Glycoside hydrolase n=1 Tax=Flavisolibacter tropicus TaxID=1492898 RepID=A0A172U372_9BACT|nr:glycoside hydrolase [Flavisolibacter tropicus]
MFTQQTTAQKSVPYFGEIKWINGYAKEITGENIGYFSAYPDYATVALLTRCTDGNKVIEWETAPVPKNIKGNYVYFSWVAAHSSGTSKGDRNFDLYVNDHKVLTFTTTPNHQNPNWSFAATDSSRIVFQQTKRDAANDAHGLAFLRLPVSKLKPGEPVKIKVVGQAQNSNDWYMTFKFSFEEKVEVAPVPFMLKSGKQPVVLTALHFGKDQHLQVKVNRKGNHSFLIKDGVNTFDIPVNAVQKNDSVFIQVSAGKNVMVSKYVLLKPVVHRELHFIHHSHTDIGYSHLQPEVLKIHIKNIDDALHMIDATKNLAKEARFKWNIESLWAVENYLKQASPAQTERFINAVKEGSICLSGLYANILTGLSQPEEVFHYTDYAEQLRKQYGVKINSAMISDIPGYAWTTVTGLAKGSIRYFSSGPNFLGETHPYGGDRVGHFVKTWGDKPVWWASPSGEEKVLFWTAGKGYSSWHGTPVGGVFDKGAKKIAAYLNELTDKNYPYEMVQWRYNIVSDNGPIDPSISDFVDQWNKKYASPKIVLNTTDKLFEAFEQKYGNSLPVVKGDITPYWEDGAISTAYEEGKNRVNSLRLQQLTTLYAILDAKKYQPSSFYEAWKNILLFHEHTWGAYNSITDPDIPFVTEQWQIKKQFMLDGDKQINELEKNLLAPLTDSLSKRIAVVNTSSWARSGMVTIPATINGKSVRDAVGKKWPLQKLSNGTYVFMANQVPALGAAVYTITNEEADAIKNNFTVTNNAVANDKIRMEWDQQGSITNLTENGSFNFAGSFNKQGLNSYWYVPGFNPTDALTNSHVQVKVLENGPLVLSLVLLSDAPGANRLERKITLYAGSNEVMIDNLIDKKAVRQKEGVHFGFPLHPSLNKVTLDAGYGSMQYLANQLPGSNMDYLYSRRWLDVSTADKGIQWMLLEAPLVEPGAIIDERQTINQTHKEWKKTGSPTATWFSYVMNNYWHTNYKADQDGVSHFRYALKPHGPFSYTETEKAGASFSQPLLALPVKEQVTFADGLFDLSNNRIVVTSLTPQEDGSIVIRLYNPEASTEQTNFLWKKMRPSQVIHLGTGKKFSVNEPITLAGMGVMEFKITQ